LLLLASVAAAILILKSPATFYRMEASGSFSRDFGEVGLLAFSGMMNALAGWFSSISMLLFLFWVLLFLPEEGTFQLPDQFRFLRLPMSLASLLVFYFCFIPSFLGEGMLQGRTENSLFFLFLVLFFLNILLWKLQLRRLIAIPNWISRLLPMVLVSSLSFSPAFRLALFDWWRGDAKEYAAERDNRDRQMRETTGDSVWVKPLLHKPKSLFVSDIGDYPDPWYDNHYAALFGKKWVQLEKEKNKQNQGR
jgi:hypothetical protein